ncbi:WecB/TagA/CpsF family glycosyltransferase [Roseococcus suduntuyensis]|nr:WecB/TagA/CpsF family glycosyltransferase [Roseococcus suduntuyensis]
MTDRVMLGVIGLAPLDTEGALAAIAARDPASPFAYVVTANAQHLALLAEPAHPLRAAYDAAWLRLNDSRVLSRLQRFATGEGFPVATGSDLTRLLFERVIAPGDALVLVGGDAALAEALRARFGLTALHLHVPPMAWAADPAAVQAALDFVRAHPARFVFVITGAPASETFLRRLAAEPGLTGTGLAVGSALRFLVGQVRRAPVWMQRSGLEWLFRLLSEPRRLWRRYLVDSMPAVVIAFRLWRRNS